MVQASKWQLEGIFFASWQLQNKASEVSTSLAMQFCICRCVYDQHVCSDAGQHLCDSPLMVLTSNSKGKKKGKYCWQHSQFVQVLLFSNISLHCLAMLINVSFLAQVSKQISLFCWKISVRVCLRSVFQSLHHNGRNVNI